MNKEKKPGRIKSAVRRWLGVPISLTDVEFWAAYAGGQSAAGKSVTVDKALQLSAVWSCVRLLHSRLLKQALDLIRDADDAKAK